MTTNERKAREFWIAELYEGVMGAYDSKEQAIKDAWRDEEEFVHHVREVLPDEVSDTERLDWIISNRVTIHLHGEGFYIRDGAGSTVDPKSYETQRQAIDAAMKESGK